MNKYSIFYIMHSFNKTAWNLTWVFLLVYGMLFGEKYYILTGCFVCLLGQIFLDWIDTLPDETKRQGKKT